jgi:hypothetical protein
MSSGRRLGNMDDPPNSVWQLLNVLRADQEQRWLSGDLKPAEQYLADNPTLLNDSASAIELIYAEYVLQERLGKNPQCADFVRRFPLLASELTSQFELDEAFESMFAEGLMFDGGSAVTVDCGHMPCDAAGGRIDCRLGKRFVVQRLLGVGSTGVVVAAFDTLWQTSLAIKTLKSPDPASILRLKQEFRKLADVTHPNLVEYYELLLHDENWSIVMELVDGVQFVDWVRAAGELNRVHCLRDALGQLVAAIDALHSKGWIHRDLKPSNVLVTRDGRVVVLDLGLASAIRDSQPQRPYLAGTVPYMSPEQCALQRITPASDWYSVGVMVYESLSGHRPFDGSIEQVLQTKQLRDPPPLSALADVPADLNELCSCLLLRDPVERSAASRSVLARYRAGAAASITPAQSLCVGRNVELKTLNNAFDAIVTGLTSFVCIQGEPGIGKSTLAEHFLYRLEGRALVLRGRCYRNASVPFTALDRIVDEIALYLSGYECASDFPAVVASLCHSFPVLSLVPALRHLHQDAATPVDREERWRQLVSAFQTLMRRLCSIQPVVMYIDDMHWGDTDSARLLSQSLEALVDCPLLLVGCYRTREGAVSGFVKQLQATWKRLAAVSPVVEFQLGPLSVQDSTKLATSLLERRAFSSNCIEQLVQSAEGSPFYLQQLTEASDERDCESSQQVTDLAEFIWERLQRLDELSLRLLTSLAVAGQPMRIADVYHAAGLGGPDPQQLSRLVKRRFLRSHGTLTTRHIDLYHDRIREVLCSHLDEIRLCSEHLRLAQALEAADGSDPVAVFNHYQAAGHDAQAGQYAALAANRAAESLAFGLAITLYQAAIRACPWNEEVLLELRRKLANTLNSAGQCAEAARMYLDLAANAKGIEELELRRCAAESFMRSGRITEAIEVLRRAFSRLGVRYPRSERMAFLGILWTKLQLWFTGDDIRARSGEDIDPQELLRADANYTATMLTNHDLIRGIYFQHRFLLLAQRLGEPRRLAFAYAFKATADFLAHPPKEGQAGEHFARADALACKVEDPTLSGYLLMVKGFANSLIGQWRRALEHSREAEAIFRVQCVGAHLEVAATHVAITTASYFLGHLKEMNQWVPTMIRECSQRQDAFSQALLGAYLGNIVWLAADDVDQARWHTREAARHWPATSYHQQRFFVLVGAVHADLYAEDYDAAWQRMSQELKPFRRSFVGKTLLYDAIWSDLLARVALGCLRTQPKSRKMARVVDRCITRLSRRKRRWSTALAHLLSAQRSLLGNNQADAMVLLQQAVSGLAATEMAFHTAAAKFCLGSLLCGEQGQQLIEDGNSYMHAQGSKSPERLARMLMPAMPLVQGGLPASPLHQ